jgi:hypothetical protein
MTKMDTKQKPAPKLHRCKPKKKPKTGLSDLLRMVQRLEKD